MNVRRLTLCAFTLAVLSFTTRAQLLPFESHHSAPQNLADDSPERNPAPQVVVTVRGQKDPRIEFWIITSYSTMNHACRTRTLGQSLWGSPEISQTVQDYVRVPAGEASFSVRLFLDQYLPGRCGWTATGISRAEYLPEEAGGPHAMSVLAFVRDNGVDHVAATYRCRRVENLPHQDPQFLLWCMPTGAFLHSKSELSIDGGTVDVDIPLAPESPVPCCSKSKSIAPPQDRTARGFGKLKAVQMALNIYLGRFSVSEDVVVDTP